MRAPEGGRSSQLPSVHGAGAGEDGASSCYEDKEVTAAQVCPHPGSCMQDVDDR
jgi:hypothetical protein